MYKFFKYEGLGNDFILFDARYNELQSCRALSDPSWAKLICDRNFGIGADGVLFLLPPTVGADVRMKIINSDGSEAEMCGNGIRCAVKYMTRDTSYQGKSIFIDTLAGVITANSTVKGDIEVNMGSPVLDPNLIPTKLNLGANGLAQGTINIHGKELIVASVGMGNPHLIIPVDNLANIPLHKWGPYLEKHTLFPLSTNVHFLKAVNKDELQLLVWERGAGPTLACGTGACASLVAAYMLGISNAEADVTLPGGKLNIRFDISNSHIFMTGPAKEIFAGNILSDNQTLFKGLNTLQ